MRKIDPDELYKPSEAARLVNRCERTIRTYILEGHIKAHLTPTGRYQILGADLQSYVESCKRRFSERNFF